MSFRFWFDLYKEGFKNLTVGKTLWKLIAIKLFVMFVVLKMLFFSDTLGTRFEEDSQKSDFVLENLTKEIK